MIPSARLRAQDPPESKSGENAAWEQGVGWPETLNPRVQCIADESQSFLLTPRCAALRWARSAPDRHRVLAEGLACRSVRARLGGCESEIAGEFSQMQLSHMPLSHRRCTLPAAAPKFDFKPSQFGDGRSRFGRFGRDLGAIPTAIGSDRMRCARSRFGLPAAPGALLARALRL